MTAEVVVVMGPARSGKTHELVRQYHAALERDAAPHLDRALWLAPNARAATAVREQLISRGTRAYLRPGVATFDNFLADVLTAAKTKLRPIAPLVARELLRRVVGQALDDDKLEFFADAAHRSGFVELLVEHIRELKRRDVRPDAYTKIVPPRGNTQQHLELAQLYAAYERQLTTHGLFDREGADWAARDALANDQCPRFQNLELIVVDGFTDFTRTQHEILRLLAERSQQLLISLPADAAPPSRRTGRLSDQSNETLQHLSSRQDLYAKTAATFAALKHFHPRLEIRQLPSRPSPWPAIDHITAHIFRHPKYAPPRSANVLDSLPQIEIIEAAGAQDEIVQIARRIKERLTEKGTGPFLSQEPAASHAVPKMDLSPFPVGRTAPGDIVVVFRSVADVAPRVEEVFDRFGIPYSLETNTPIARAAIVKSLLALLRLDLEDWPFRRVVSVVTNNTLTALADSPRRAADWLVRELQFATGRKKLLERIAELASQQDAADEHSEQHERRIEAAVAALPALSQLAAALDQLPTEATLNEWSASLSRLATDLGLAPFEQLPPLRTGRLSDQSIEHPASRIENRDLDAWQAIVAHFAALERLDAWLGAPPRKLSRRELVAALLDIATNEPLPRRFDEVGRVRVLAAQSARAVTARHLFLAGMSEQAFPAPEGVRRLATEAEYRFYTNATHQEDFEGTTRAAPHATRAQEEMLLFYEVLSRAKESLTISYPALDDKAQQLPPSPYVVELKRMFADEGKSRIRRAKPQLSPVPQHVAASLDSTELAEVRDAGERVSERLAHVDRSARGIYSLADWRVRAVAQAVQTDGNGLLLAGVFACDETKPVGSAIDAGLRTVHARARGESFGPSEGLLTSPAVAARLTQHFGPQHLWSPSQWETYAACPFKFFLEAVLGLEPLRDLVIETDFTRRGSRLHHVLAAFHRQWPNVRGGHSLDADEEGVLFLAHLQQVIEERIASTPRGGIDAALLELDRRQIRKWANRHFEHHVKYGSGCAKLGAPMTPAHFEFRFGPPRRGDTHADPNSTSDAFELDIGGEPIRITGQIDRIDIGTVGGQTVFNVIDYKSGRRPALKLEQIATGQQLQLPIYVEAAQVLLFGGEATPLAAGYWSMAGGFDEKGALAVRQEGDSGARWGSTQATVRQLIREFVAGIRHGDFPVASRDDKCTSYCEFSLVCRVAQARSVGKTWWPEAACGLAQNESETSGEP